MDLKDIKAAVEAKYISLPITFEDAEGNKKELQLRNMLRLSEAEQGQVIELGKELKDGEAQTFSEAKATFVQYLTILSGNKPLVDLFLQVIDNDFAVILYVVEEYQRVTQAEKA